MSFARSVMVSDVQKHFAKASFPPELRLQVMKAGVPYNTTCKLSTFRSMKTMTDLRNEAHSFLLFPPRQHWYQLDPWADEEISDIVKSTAEQAFLEIVIFKLAINRSLPTAIDQDWISGLSSFATTIGPRIHFLNLTTTIHGTYGPYDQLLPWDVTWCRSIVTCMNMLKRRFTNLKACVLTLDVGINWFGTPRDEPFNQVILLQDTRTHIDFKPVGMNLAAEATRLFDAFVTEGPGKSQFIRMRLLSRGLDVGEIVEGYSFVPLHYGPLVKVDLLKMAAVSQIESFGAQLLKDAYRLERTGRQSMSELYER